MVARLESVPAPVAYKYTDYWGTEVNSFDLHTPHTELKVIAASVVETTDQAAPSADATWSQLRSPEVLDEYGEYLE